METLHMIIPPTLVRNDGLSLKATPQEFNFQLKPYTKQDF